MSEGNIRQSILCTTVFFFIALAAGIIATMKYPEIGTYFLSLFKDSVMEDMIGDSPASLCVKIFLNNLTACLLLFAGGVSMGIVTLFILATNGIIIGSIVQMIGEKQGVLFVLASLVPHGIFEIPSFILSGALGFLLAGRLWNEWHSGDDAAADAAHYGAIFVRTVVPLVIIAALVEAFITPEIIRLVV